MSFSPTPPVNLSRGFPKTRGLVRLRQLQAEPASEELRSLIDEMINAPFVLSSGNLFRAEIIKTPSEAYLALSLHHIISDFWSLFVILDDLGGLYDDPNAPEPTRAAYGDFTRWQRELVTGPEGRRMLAFWRERLAGNLPVLELPMARPRPEIQTFSGAMIGFELDAEITVKLKRLAGEENTTLYVLLLAVFRGAALSL